jgi:hypothetical protein
VGDLLVALWKEWEIEGFAEKPLLVAVEKQHCRSIAGRIIGAMVFGMKEAWKRCCYKTSRDDKGAEMQ